jgi:pimeloyl-ACP methyl ester carboxylesterase
MTTTLANSNLKQFTGDDSWLQKKQLVVNGHLVVYWEYIPKQNYSKTLVLVHGLAGSHLGLTSLGAGLKSFRLIIPDLPGCGLSPAAARVKSLSEHGDFLHQFARALSLQEYMLIGHSTGGNMVMIQAAKYNTAASIVLITPAVTLQKWIYYFTKVLLKLMFLPKRIRKVILLSRFSQFFLDRKLTKYPDKNFRKQVKQIRLKELAQIDHVTALISTISVFKDPLIKYAKGVKCPTFFIVGGDDIVVDTESIKGLANKVTPAKIEEFKQSGHLIQIEEPGLCARAIMDFLK